jgi:hypothetical protein
MGKTVGIYDYISKLAILYPDISEKDIIKILNLFQIRFMNLIWKGVSILIRPMGGNRTKPFLFLFNGISTYNALLA